MWLTIQKLDRKYRKTEKNKIRKPAVIIVTWDNFDIEKEAENIYNIFKKKNIELDIDLIKEQLLLYQNKYLIKDLESAVRGIVKNFGGTDDDFVANIKPTDIADMKTNVSCSVVAKVLGFEKKITSDKMKLYIDAYDNTAHVTISSDNAELKLEKNCTYRFSGCKYSVSSKGYAGIYLNGKTEKVEDAKIEPIGELIKTWAVGPAEIKEKKFFLTVHGIIRSVSFGGSVNGTIRIGDEDFSFVSFKPLPLNKYDEIYADKLNYKYSDKYGWQLVFSNDSLVLRV